MKLTLLGTGGSLPDSLRGGPSALVTHDGVRMLVGCGEQTVHRLLQAGVAPEQVGTLLFTSPAFEYTSDFGRFVLTGWIRGRREPLTVLGPPGTETICTRILDLHAGDIHARLSADRLDPNGIRLDAHEITSGDQDCGAVHALSVPGLTVRAVRTGHDAGQPAHAYSFDTAQGRVVLCGPSRPSEDLTALAEGCDLLVLEAYYPPALDSVVAAQPHNTHWANGVRRDTATVAEAAELAATADCGALVLTGLSPSEVDGDEILTVVRTVYAGQVVLAEDLFTWNSASS